MWFCRHFALPSADVDRLIAILDAVRATAAGSTAEVA